MSPFVTSSLRTVSNRDNKSGNEQIRRKGWSWGRWVREGGGERSDGLSTNIYIYIYTNIYIYTYIYIYILNFISMYPTTLMKTDNYDIHHCGMQSPMN